MPETDFNNLSIDPNYPSSQLNKKPLSANFLNHKAFLVVSLAVTILLLTFMLKLFENDQETSLEPLKTKTSTSTDSSKSKETQPLQKRLTDTIYSRKLTDNVGLDFYPEHYKILKDPDAWVIKLNEAYLAFENLIGTRPHNGDKIIIKEVKDLKYGEMIAGNPILWWDTYVPEKLMRVNTQNDLSFGPIHELGHDFDITPGSYHYIGSGDTPINAEQWANFKLTYVADELGKKYSTATFYQAAVGNIPITTFTDKYFVDIYAKEWLSSSKKDWTKMKGDAFTGLLYTLTKKYGWEPFKKTFREYVNIETAIPKDDLAKIQLFADKLSKNSNKDLVPEFQSWGIPL